jgi:hypothetical protein
MSNNPYDFLSIKATVTNLDSVEKQKQKDISHDRVLTFLRPHHRETLRKAKFTSERENRFARVDKSRTWEADNISRDTMAEIVYAVMQYTEKVASLGSFWAQPDKKKKPWLEISGTFCFKQEEIGPSLSVSMIELLPKCLMGEIGTVYCQRITRTDGSGYSRIVLNTEGWGLEDYVCYFTLKNTRDGPLEGSVVVPWDLYIARDPDDSPALKKGEREAWYKLQPKEETHAMIQGAELAFMYLHKEMPDDMIKMIAGRFGKIPVKKPKWEDIVPEAEYESEHDDVDYMMGYQGYNEWYG